MRDRPDGKAEGRADPGAGLFGEQAAAVALLWGTRPPLRRGPRPSLTLERIAQAAIALADAEGIAALSMERLARELGYTTMALYRYVPGKAELLALIIDHGLGGPPAHRAGRPWRDGLARWARALLRIFERHPWSLEATAGLRVMGPRELRWLEAGLDILAPTALSPGEARSACLALVAQVRTTAQFSGTRANGLGGDRWLAATRALVGTQPGSFPRLHEALGGRPRRGRPEVQWAWVLDGIEARMERVRPRRRRGSEVGPRPPSSRPRR